MAIRTDVSINWRVSPRLLTVAAPSTEITVQEIVDTCRFLEDSPRGIAEPDLIDAAGKEPLGGTTYVGITATLQDAYIAFEARPGPDWVLCIISGGNIVAVDSNGAELDPRYPTAYVTVDRTASASATLQEQTDIQYSSYADGVTIDVDNVTGLSSSGDDHPIGTPRQPVDNIADALLIQTGQGLPKRLYVIGDLEVSGSTDLSNWEIVGQSKTKSTITIGTLANTSGLEIIDASVTGTLDGDNFISECTVSDLTYVNGELNRCGLIGDIILGGAINAAINDCFTVDQDDPPGIDMGGSGQSLAMPNYSGLVTIKNLNDATQNVGIGLNHGAVVVDSDVVDFNQFIIAGIGSCQDNSVIGVNTDALISNQAIANSIWAADEPARLLGLMQENHYIDQNVYNGDGHLTSARIRLYSAAGSVGTDNDVIATYTMAATWSGDEMTNYKVVKS